jgi:hypothetical protein
MPEVYMLAIDLAKRSFQVCATDRGGGVCGCPRICKGILDDIFGLALLSVVCQASCRDLMCATGPVCSSKNRGHIGSESLTFEPRDWLSLS